MMTAKVMTQLYEYSDPTEKVDTQWGLTTVKEWLKLEKKRIEKDPARKATIKKEGGMIALFVDLPEGVEE